MPSILSSSLRFLGANYFRFTVVVVVSFISPFAVAVAVTVRSSSAHSCVKIFPTARKRKSPKLLRAPTPPLLLRQICPASLTLVPLLMEIPHPSYGFCLITSRKNGLTVLPRSQPARRQRREWTSPIHASAVFPSGVNPSCYNYRDWDSGTQRDFYRCFVPLFIRQFSLTRTNSMLRCRIFFIIAIASFLSSVAASRAATKFSRKS